MEITENRPNINLKIPKCNYMGNSHDWEYGQAISKKTRKCLLCHKFEYCNVGEEFKDNG
jgi:hypothetical protein